MSKVKNAFHDVICWNGMTPDEREEFAATPIARAQQAMQSAADVRHAWLYEAGERLRAERLGDAYGPGSRPSGCVEFHRHSATRFDPYRGDVK